ncbi:MAG: phosphatase PAP2 family protein [Acetobacter sp.]|nr:phosphatase PAP2 family protein [Acetobacter sp.]
MITTVDFQITDWVQTVFRNSVTDAVMPVITVMGDNGYVWLGLSFVLMAFKQTRKTGFLIFGAIFIGAIICNLTLKPFVERLRPCAVRPELTHTRFAWAGVILACLIAFSRIYMGFHFFTDIMGGMVAGTLAAFIAVEAEKRIKRA